MAAGRAQHQVQSGEVFKALVGMFSHVVVGIAPDGEHHVVSWHDGVNAAIEHAPFWPEEVGAFASKHVEGINGGERPALVA